MAIEHLESSPRARPFVVPVPTQAEATPRVAPTAPPISVPVVRIGLQLALGYEWLASGLDKVLYGRFPTTLGSQLAGILHGGAIPASFAALLRVVALPHPVFFGLLVEWGEALAGLGLLAAALAALLAPTLERRLAPGARVWIARTHRALDALALAAAAGTVLLGISFYLLDGAPPFWLVPSVAFGGAVDTGLLLAALAVPLLLAPLLAWARRR
jgi:hypothetical protein